MPTLRYVVADVFTGTPLAGNQLAVSTDARDVPDELMRRLAREMNFSEGSSSNSRYVIRKPCTRTRPTTG